MVDCDVIVVGCGLAGASVAYHLKRAGVEPVIMDAGRPGRGNDKFLSGTESPIGHSKMVLSSFESTAVKFCEKYGVQAARDYVGVAQRGRELQKFIANSLNPSLVRSYGTVGVASAGEFDEMADEFPVYRDLGVDVYLKSGDDVNALFGSDVFVGGLYFPRDGIIDSKAYVRSLIDSVDVLSHTEVVGVCDSIDEVVLSTVCNGVREDVSARQVVFATNGFFDDVNLYGLLRKAWAFIVCFEDDGPNTPNAFNYADDYFDWTRQDGVLQVGGCQEVPVCVPFDERQSLNKIVSWSKRTFTRLNDSDVLLYHWGELAYTFDERPIVGKFDENSRVSYIVGCNAIGQSLLSYGASLLPGIIGRAELSDEQKRFCEFLSPRRATLQKF